jgi:hypothetical protein
MGNKPKEDDEMNRVIGVMPAKQGLIILLVGVGVLTLAGIAAQAVLTAEPASAVELAPRDASGLEIDVRGADNYRTFTQAREAAGPGLNIDADAGIMSWNLTFTQAREAASEADSYPSFTQVREVAGPGLNIDADVGIMPWNLTFTQAREGA